MTAGEDNHIDRISPGADGSLSVDGSLGKKQRRKLSVRFAAMNGTFLFGQCFTFYLTTFLMSRGWTSGLIGILNSVNSIVSAVASPLWGAISDKIRSVKKVLILLVVCSALTYALVPVMDWKIAGISVLFLLIPFSMFFRGTILSLIDNWTIRSCNRSGLNYGAIRSVGSIAFGIAGLVLGFLVPRLNERSASGDLGVRLTFLFFGLSLLFLLFIILNVREEKQGGSTGKQRFRDLHFGSLLKNYHYMTFLIYAIVIQLPLSCISSFFPFLLEELNVDLSYVGYIQGIKAFIEVPMLLLLDRIRNRCPLYRLLMISGLLYMIQVFLYSISGNFTELLLLCLVQGTAGGLNIAAGTNYVATLAPKELKATAQTLYASMNAVAGILGNAIGGILIELIGIRMFYRYIAYVLFGAVLFFALTFPFGERVLKIPRPRIIRHGVGESH